MAMVSFVSIMHVQEGFAAYQVREQDDGFHAKLLKTTSAEALPDVIALQKPLLRYRHTSDLLVAKLLKAINANRKQHWDIA